MNERYSWMKTDEIGQTRKQSRDLIKSHRNKKAREYAKFKHQDEYNNPMFSRDVSETLSDFKDGLQTLQH